MYKFLFYSLWTFVLSIFTASHALAQDCPNNTEQHLYQVFNGTGPTFESACLAVTSLTDVRFIPFNECSGKNSSGQTLKRYITNLFENQCRCPSGTLAATNSNGEITGCTNFTNPETDSNSCSNSWDILSDPTCATANANCAASGGQFGFFNEEARCIPSNYNGDSGDPTPSCTDSQTLTWDDDGFLFCADNDPNDPDNPNPPGGDGGDGDGDGDGDGSTPTPTNSGGTKESTDDDGNPITLPCNPFTDSECTPNANNQGAGQCDPESNNYYECIASSRTATASDSCEVPPSCSGDAIFCALLNQQHNLKCAASSVTDDCANPFTCNGDAILCSVALSAYQSKCLVQELTDFAATDPDVANPTIPTTEFNVTTDIEDAMQASSFLPGTCPAPTVMELGLFGNQTIDYDPWCSACVEIEPIVIGIGMIAGLYIIFGFRRNKK